MGRPMMDEKTKIEVLRIADELHKFASATDAPPGQAVLGWFDMHWTRLIEESKLSKHHVVYRD